MTLIVLIILLLVMTVPSNAVLRCSDGELTSMEAPLMAGMVPIIMILFLLPGIAYGVAAKTVKNSTDVAKYMSEAMSDMGGYIALAFAAGQFVAYFEWSEMVLF